MNIRNKAMPADWFIPGWTRHTALRGGSYANNHRYGAYLYDDITVGLMAAGWRDSRLFLGNTLLVAT